MHEWLWVEVLTDTCMDELTRGATQTEEPGGSEHPAVYQHGKTHIVRRRKANGEAQGTIL